MYILRALVFLFLTQAVLAQQPTPILPDPKLTPGDTFDVTAESVCVHGNAKKVRSVPAWLKRQAYDDEGNFERGSHHDHFACATCFEECRRQRLLTSGSSSGVS